MAVTSHKKEPTTEEILKLLFSYTTKIAEERDLDSILILMRDLGVQMVCADRCTVWVYDKQSNELWSRVANGVDELRIPANTGIVSIPIQTGEPLIVNDAYADPRFNSNPDKVNDYKTNAIMVIPIKDNDGNVLGAFQALNKMTKDGKFTDQDIERLTLTASYSAKAIESARLLIEIEETQREIIFFLGSVGECRSKETGAHVKRVAEYCYMLSKHYGLPEEKAKLVKMASPMHDIGKMAMPDSILEKPGILTDQEFKTMQNHPQIGYDMLKNSKRDILKAAAIIAHQHHEKFDGTGYPRGTKGKEIHIFGRICAVADVFDALASKRAYKEAWSDEHILEEFKSLRGKHFDPELVDILIDHYDEFSAISKDSRDR